MKLMILIIINIIIIYFLWFQKVEKTTLSIGMFSFELKISDNLKPLKQAIDYIESHEKDENKTNLTLRNLSNYYFKETSKRNFLTKVKNFILFWEKKEPEKIIIRRLLAKLFALKMGNIIAAEQLIRKNIEENKNYKDLIFLGDILSYKQPINNEEILNQYKEALKLKKCVNDVANYKITLMNIHLRKGHILFNSGNYDEAIEKYLKVIELNPWSFAAYSGLGNSYLKKSNWDDALKNFDKAIIYSVGNKSHIFSSRLNKALILFEKKDNPYEALKQVDLGIKTVEEEYKKYPFGSKELNELANNYFYRGVLLKHIGKLIEAKEDFIRCSHITTNNALSEKCIENISEINKK